MHEVGQTLRKLQMFLLLFIVRLRTKKFLQLLRLLDLYGSKTSKYCSIKLFINSHMTLLTLFLSRYLASAYMPVQ